jgi:hypothetical protein
VIEPYSGREQTKAKHFILKRYLQALAFKVLRYFDVTYVDGFSGPWETQTEDFADSSFRIAIDVLRDAQKQILAQPGDVAESAAFFQRTNQRPLLNSQRPRQHFTSPKSISKSRLTTASSKMPFPKFNALSDILFL